MRIDSYNSAGVGSASVDKTAELAASQQKTTAAAEVKKKQDSVELSGLSQALSASSVDEARLERLHQSVAAGTYNVSAEDLSRSIVNDALGKP
jgi:flagellar biosynthesis anti-sigma factor FlgM